MSRKDDIYLILDSIKNDYAELFSSYNESLFKKSTDPKLSLKVKNYLENAKSTLDYLAHEIGDKTGVPKDQKIYFPIIEQNKNIDSFKGAVERNLPALEKKRKDVYDLLESLQPYQKNNEWLGDLANIVNVHKHNLLIPQRKTETQRITSKHVDGRSVSWDPSGVIFNNGVYINDAPINPASQMPIETPETTITREIWVDFVFDDDKKISVIGLIKNIKEKLPEIVEKIFSIL